uniref:Serine/threonine-protein phosphatase 2A regulatory subunit B'' subunit alpha/beta/delta EF-hand domain-containing protein n=1 Tax=Heterorhabditis bacteriophora TaxID=37862 RepID=A0A1I7WDV3_HETBA
MAFIIDASLMKSWSSSLWLFQRTLSEKSYCPSIMKDVVRPPDAVLCECSLLAARKPQRSGKSRTFRENRSRSITRFIETLVRKVFDSQRKSKTNATFNISSELNETPVTKLSKQLAEFYVTSPINNSISPRANGHKIEEIGHNETRKQPDYDTSSGTSDGSLNATHGAKGFEESLLIDDKNILFTNDDVYTLTSPKRTITLPKKQPSVNYPRFHFPQGRPVSQVENDAALRRVCEVFKELPDQQCSMADMPRICQAANLPLYWKMPILNSLTKGESQRAIQTDFTAWWRAMTSIAHDEASRFVYTLIMNISTLYTVSSGKWMLIMTSKFLNLIWLFTKTAVSIFLDTITDMVLDRIFSPAVRQRDIHVPKKAQCMNLAEFTNFLLADEDKTHPSSKMFDMICPENGSSFRLSDLKKSPLSVRFINSLVNWRKFYTQEVTEGLLESYSLKYLFFHQIYVGSERVLDETGRELTDWERFCSEEYETMMDNEDDVDENISVNLDDEDLKTNLSY